MKSTKVNIELSLSQNYDKITIGIRDEPIEYETDEEFNSKVKEISKKIRNLIKAEFKEVAEDRNNAK